MKLQHDRLRAWITAIFQAGGCQPAEAERIGLHLVEANLVDCMVALPPQLFYNTQIPACLWFLNRNKPAHR